MLEAAGFIAGQDGLIVTAQPAAALLALRLLVSVIPAICLVFAIVMAWRYPLNRQAHLQIRQQLAQRRGADDPPPAAQE